MIDFVRREKIYVLMLLFIIAINLLHAGQKEEKKEQITKEYSSSLTFKEIGITEAKIKTYLEGENLNARIFRYAISIGFLIFILALFMNLIFIFKGKKIYVREGLKDAVPWGISDLLRASIIIIFLGYILGFFESLFLKIFHIEIDINLRMILNTFIIDSAAALIILYFVCYKYKEKIQVLGLRFSSFFKNVFSAIMAYVFILPLLVLVLILSVWILILVGYEPPPQPVFEVFMEEKRSDILLFLAIFVSLFGPVIEEMFFRGFMYTTIKKRFGVQGAALVSAGIFSMLHTNIVGFLPILALGMLLAYLYETTGSLVAPITVHVIHNTIILGFVFFVKDLIRLSG